MVCAFRAFGFLEKHLNFSPLTPRHMGDPFHGYYIPWDDKIEERCWASKSEVPFRNVWDAIIGVGIP